MEKLFDEYDQILASFPKEAKKFLLAATVS